MNRPLNEGGNDSAATPIEMLLTAIGGCVSMTLKVFADKNNLNLGQISVNVRHTNVLNTNGLVSTITEDILFENSITEYERIMLLNAAKECPVVKMLKSETKIKTNIL
jgi:putative redox protein